MHLRGHILNVSSLNLDIMSVKYESLKSAPVGLTIYLLVGNQKSSKSACTSMLSVSKFS